MSHATYRPLLQPRGISKVVQRLVAIGCLFALAVSVWFGSFGASRCLADPQDTGEPTGALGIHCLPSWKPRELLVEYWRFHNLPPTSGHGALVIDRDRVHAEGIKVLDIIISLNGIRWINEASYSRSLATLRKDELCELEIKRLDETGRRWNVMKLKIKAADRDEVAAVRAGVAAKQAEVLADERMKEDSKVWECPRCHNQYVGRQPPIDRACGAYEGKGQLNRYCHFVPR
jgi:hypothetical protein